MRTDWPPQPVSKCEPCEHASPGKGWGHSIPRNATHCKKCHRTWTSKREIHCVKCCAHFSTPENCDLHYQQGPICKDPASIKRLKLVDRRSGPTWVGAGEFIPRETDEVDELDQIS